MITAIAPKHTTPCGCSGKPAAPRSNPSCGCGCGGCGSCGGNKGCDGGPNGEPACTLGTEEATRRPGTVSDPRMKPRPRFFRGELVGDVDLTAIVDYARCHDRLDNHVMGGWGIYCGYALEVDASCCCVRIGPGVAYDALGRSLVNAQSVCLERPKLSETGLKDPCDPNSPPVDRTLWLAVAYDDCLDAARPRYSTPCGDSNDPGCDFTRIRERVRFVWLEEEPPPEYWISGCLGDPCAPPAGETQDGCDLVADEPIEPRLDRCTPPIGIRGGAGVARYAQAILQAWNLPRNIEVLANTKRQPGACDGGVGAIVDVISGVACTPCPGEALVLLARVTFTSAGCGTDQIEVVPLRRRVLSNADLTYVLWWLIDQVVCGPRPQGAEAEPEQPAGPINCEDDREHAVEEAVCKLADRIAGETTDPKRIESIRARLLYKRYIERVPLKRLNELEQQVEVLDHVLGRPTTPDERDELAARNAQAIGKGARRPYVEVAALDLFGKVLSGRDRSVAFQLIDRVFARHSVLHLQKLSVEARKKTVEQLASEVKAPLTDQWLDTSGGPQEPSMEARLAELEQIVTSIPEAARALKERRASAKAKGQKKGTKQDKLEVPPLADDDEKK